MSLSLFTLQLKLFLKKPIKLLITLFVPFACTWLLFNLFEETQENLSIPIAIVDEDQSETSAIIIERIKALNEIQVHVVDNEDAERQLLQGKIDSIFVFTEGFEEKLMEEDRDQTILVRRTSNSIAYGIVQELLASEVTRISSNMKAANTVVQYYRSLQPELHPDKVWQDAYLHSDEYWVPEPLMGIDYEWYNVQGKTMEATESQYTANFWRIWSFITVLMVLTSFQWYIRAKEEAIASRLTTTMGGAKVFVLGVGGAHLLLQVVQGLITFILYSVFFETDWSQMGYVIWLTIIAFALGLLLAQWLHNKGSYYVAAFFVSCLFAVLGESFFPISELYSPLEKAAFLSPIGMDENIGLLGWSLLALVIGIWVTRKSGERLD
ncbi:ABC-2 type transport system permease protein [Bacillus oleivorans]|uniref:ABC-2 type transport system permease protein n=1 Tax=Bacillus oleivorans TaxID=1448271 RepID=A0A285CHA3_9BACI|nr:ABC transporter permease [Bacillus oleivorans]SNX66982.1 ABC-2 type transport system permease protein [Bacillus oleivorans]